VRWLKTRTLTVHYRESVTVGSGNTEMLISSLEQEGCARGGKSGRVEPCVHETGRSMNFSAYSFVLSSFRKRREVIPRLGLVS